MPTLPRDIPPFESVRIGDNALPKEFVRYLQDEWKRLYDLRDYLLNLFVDNETPNGTQDGVNKSFTLKFSPFPAESLLLFISKTQSGTGVLQIFGVDYVLTGASIQYKTAPSNTDFQRAYYRHVMTAPGAAVTGDTSQTSAATAPPSTPSGPGAGGGAGAGGTGIMQGNRFAIFDPPGFAVVFNGS